MRVAFGFCESQSSISVRFSADITARLKAVSDNSGIPLLHLIRLATELYLAHDLICYNMKIEQSKMTRNVASPMINVVVV